MIIYGLTLMIIGFVQIFSAIIRVICAKRQSSTYAIKLKQYLLLVVIFFTINYAFILYDVSEFYLFSYLFIIPPFIALWYYNHINTWRKKHKRIKEYDNQLLLEVPCKERLMLDSLPKRQIKLMRLKNGLQIKTAII